MKKKTVLLKAEKLIKEYGEAEGLVRALNCVDLEIYDGEFLVILGSSGSGKSTLLNLIGGMDYPSSGSIFVDDKDICSFDDDELTDYRKNKIGFVFQSFNLLQELTAAENVAMVMDEVDKDRIAAVFSIVGLSEKMNKYPKELSGGEQQRVSIARALVKDPGILLCDEPTGALDYESGKMILCELEKLVKQQHKTVVVVTHTKEIGKMANRIITIRNGQIVSVDINRRPVAAKKIEW